MKLASMIHALAICTGLACAPAFADMRDTPVPVDVTGIQPNLAAKIEKHAAVGLTSLSRFLARTRKQHNLVVEDVVKDPEIRAQVEFSAKEYKRHAQEWRQQAKN